MEVFDWKRNFALQKKTTVCKFHETHSLLLLIVYFCKNEAYYFSGKKRKVYDKNPDGGDYNLIWKLLISIFLIKRA